VLNNPFEIVKYILFLSVNNLGDGHRASGAGKTPYPKALSPEPCALSPEAAT